MKCLTSTFNPPRQMQLNERTWLKPITSRFIVPGVVGPAAAGAFPRVHVPGEWRQRGWRGRLSTIDGLHSTQQERKGCRVAASCSHEATNSSTTLSRCAARTQPHLFCYYPWRSNYLTHDSCRDEILWNLRSCSASNFASPSET